MLYGQSKQYLLEKLVAAGLKSRPYTALKALQKSQESHIGAVLFEREAYARNGSKKYFKSDEGAKHKRRRVFDRDLGYAVTIGGYTDEEVEGILEAFLSSLDDGIYVDGNFVPIEPEGAVWFDTEDRLLKAQVAVQLTVVFHGGVYRDTGFGRLRRVEVTGIEKKEGDTDGK